jgi:hypothetical protein
VNDDIVTNLLITAFEGGSNYWYAMLQPAWGDEEEGSLEYWHAELPLTETGGVVFMDVEEDQLHHIDRATLEAGWAAFKETHHYQDAIDENDDAWTGDAFLQCCCFGEVIYG